MRVTWQELERICLLLGCQRARIKGDHLVMTRPGMARPVIIKMDRDLGEDIVRSNMRTLGVEKKQFEALLNQVRGGRSGRRSKEQGGIAGETAPRKQRPPKWGVSRLPLRRRACGGGRKHRLATRNRIQLKMGTLRLGWSQEERFEGAGFRRSRFHRR